MDLTGSRPQIIWCTGRPLRISILIHFILRLQMTHADGFSNGTNSGIGFRTSGTHFLSPVHVCVNKKTFKNWIWQKWGLTTLKGPREAALSMKSECIINISVLFHRFAAFSRDCDQDIIQPEVRVLARSGCNRKQSDIDRKSYPAWTISPPSR